MSRWYDVASGHGGFAERPDGDAPSELVVQIDGGPGETPALLVISRPDAGHVRVREWSGEDWSGIPGETLWRIDDLYARLERARHARRRITAEMYAIRAWLSGT